MLRETTQNVSRISRTSVAIGDYRGDSLGVFIVGAVIEEPAIFGFPHATPLFKKERDVIDATLIADRGHPLFLHRTRTRAALPTDDSPINAGKVKAAKVLKEGFN